ncbi:hypothetical protein DACRYDRAFT_108558 [Dacryopinax primogenitus]|uniref:Aminoglycoside phosphotransferase domain-containing protein n=1 Tax=Dacryopinax primogenitus (strain DJM 731) TaxID=1858805 RepID=M5FSN7_DACPD|nr:uncharacterized protein DACRYDRAFT_108558 [Dacryopinax primogenitus]EJU00491.1 hypothetical protein DACRYDRAFT_108558 [Dacryopinax primogenitus]
MSYWVQWLWDTLTGSKQPNVKFCEPSAPTITLDDIDHFYKSGQWEKARLGCLEEDGLGVFGHNVSRMSESVAVKCMDWRDRQFEPYTMRLISTQTSIPTPRVHECLIRDRTMFFVMDYIDGEDFYTLWPNLSLFGKCRIMWTIRRYIRELRTWKPPVPDIPGPVDATEKPVRCIGTEFGEGPAGPFNSYADLYDWFEHKRALAVDMAKNWFHYELDEKKLPHFDSSMPLVFTHGDISMHNIRISRDGTVWLLDWGSSGMYPP